MKTDAKDNQKKEKLKRAAGLTAFWKLEEKEYKEAPDGD